MTIGISLVVVAILLNVMAISRNVCEIRRTTERMRWYLFEHMGGDADDKRKIDFRHKRH